MSVANLEAPSAKGRVAVLARFGEASIPPPGTLLQEDDVLHVVIAADNAAAARGGAAPQRGIALMNVIIAGAGSVGRYMAGQLQDSGHERDA